MDTTKIPLKIKPQWDRARPPIVVRSGLKGDKLTARLPYQVDNREWLSGLGTGARKPNINYDRTGKIWKLPTSWLDRFVERALGRYGSLYVVQPYRVLETCAPACRNATGHKCSCSCMGENHGVGDGGGWFDISETLSFRWGPREAAIRLMTKKG